MKPLFALVLMGTLLATLAAAPVKPALGHRQVKHVPLKPAAGVRGGSGRVGPKVSAAGGNRAGTRRVVVRRMVRGRWVKVTRIVRTRGPVVQQHPDPERLRQIQQALADRGYFKGEPNGQWNGDSVDALKRFQANQNLAADGKINSLSLIGLGLGARHDGSGSASLAPQTQPAITPTAPH